MAGEGGRPGLRTGAAAKSNDSMKLDVYVNYAGTCEEAFRFYEQHLGGKVAMMMRHLPCSPTRARSS